MSAAENVLWPDIKCNMLRLGSTPVSTFGTTEMSSLLKLHLKWASM